MTTYVALLRSVNLAGRRRIKMDELRQAFRALGYTDVTTYIQSGNVVFTSDAKVGAAGLEHAIAAQFGMNVTVVLRTSRQLETVAQRNPYRDANTSKVHVGFMPRPPSAAAARTLDLQRFSPDDAVVEGSELYLHLPNGMGRSKLPDYLGRQLEVPITIRNWNTVTKLIELAIASN
jgi:uncharacterized protein (DUF1697 family)